MDKSATLMVYRPSWRDDKWTAVQDGPVYQLFPRPENFATDTDAVPLTYRDYFGPGNVGVDVNGQPVNPDTRFDLPLEKVREEMVDELGADIHRGEYRYLSGSPSNAARLGGAEEDVMEQVREVPVGRKYSPEVEYEEYEEYEEYGFDWDVADADMSDSP